MVWIALVSYSKLAMPEEVLILGPYPIKMADPNGFLAVTMI